MNHKRFTEVTINELLETLIREPIHRMKKSAKKWALKNWYKLLFLGICIFFVVQKDLNFNIHLKSKNHATSNTGVITHNQPIALNVSNIGEHPTNNKGEFLFGSILSSKATPIKKEKPIVMTKKVRKQLAYVKQYEKIAKKEMAQFGIPASVTLAQGLIETNAGESRLATKNNNHFGIKCFSKKCKKGHCSNFSDDTHKDFFRIYKNAGESYRSHSKLLLSKRYKHLLDLGKENYKDWAIGLKKAGYATDKNYHSKLIQLIEDLHLYKYDE